MTSRGFRIGSAVPNARTAGSEFGGSHGRYYTKPSTDKRGIDIRIPPRAKASGRATHSTEETDDAFVVRIDFPEPVRPEEIRWEQNADVLDVEYLGRTFHYYHAFLVPADRSPAVEHNDRSWLFRFLR